MPSSNHITPTDTTSTAHARPQNEYALTQAQDGPTLVVRGEIDLYGKGSFEAALTQAAERWQEGAAFTVDLVGVQFIDSSSLSALLCQWRQLPSGTHFVLRVLQNSIVSRVLCLSKWDSIFDIQIAATE